MSAVNASRDRTVQGMFDRIAERYDLLNRVISFRMDSRWRRQVIREVMTRSAPRVLDLGTGTGDLVFDASKASKGNGTFIGLDFSLQMLRLAQIKRGKFSHAASTAFVSGSAMTMPFRNNFFDGVMTAFVLRNVSDLSLLFAEAHRVLKPGGKFVSLDMFPPSATWFSALYSVYFHRVMPRIGALLARDRNAYQYLSDSVRRFHRPETVTNLIEQAGFQRVVVQKFLSGAVCMHVGSKLSTPPRA
jgi:demethylmenaquinone methyltransferase / 2-methoxy-6-polyprenyl-1,4-benzoquinol methylase